MAYKGHMKNGVIILDESAPFEEGTEVRVDCVKETPPTIAERLAPIIGTVDGLPEDASENHDHYLYGAPKK